MRWSGSLAKRLPPSGAPANGLRPDHSRRREWLERGLLTRRRPDIEGATGLDASLTARFAAADVEVAGVLAKLARRVRMLSTARPQTDQADALSVGICRARRRDDLVSALEHRPSTGCTPCPQLVPAGLPAG